MRVPPLRGKNDNIKMFGAWSDGRKEEWCDGYLALGCRHDTGS